MALQVDRDHGVPLVLLHVDEHPVAQDPRVVDEDVEPAEGVQRMVYEPLGSREVGDVLPVRDGLAAGRGDLVDNLLRRRVLGLAHHGDPEIVDEHTRARLCERERVRPADSAAGTGDDRDLSAEVGHLLGH